MHSCRCSTRALELFVKDLAALNVRTLSQPSRQFSARPARRQVNSASIKKQEPAYVPFDTANAPRRQPFDSQSRPSGSHGEALLGADSQGASEEWHAELEILQPNHGQDGESLTVPSQLHTEPVQDTNSVDSIKLPRLAESGEPTRLAVKIPEIKYMTPAPITATKPQNSARKERKMKRTQEGTFKSAARARKAGEAQEDEQNQEVEVEDQMISVMKNLESMQGVGELLPPKVRKERKPRSETGRNAPKAKKEGDANATQKQPPKIKRERWQIQKDALESKLGDQPWNPRKRLSPDTLDGIRALHASNPNAYSTEVLSEHFKVTPENIRRILKSKWRPNADEVEDRRARWEKRGVKKWSEMAELGLRPPKQWREMGVGSVKGEPDEKPAWKKGGRRKNEASDWGEESTAGSIVEQGLADRIL
ncbi:hypothetical protein MBLNU230_g8365t1 [Neophaeotheca triangularis]